MRLSLLPALAFFVVQSTAVFTDEAWTLDYHYALLGEPQAQTTFFHQPSRQSPANLLYTLSAQGVLGAVNPKDGTLVWRKLLSDINAKTNPPFLRSGQDQDIVVSGYDSKIAAWSAADGRQAWELSGLGVLEDLEILEIPDGKQPADVNDVVVMTSGGSATVYRVDASSGAIKWRHKFEGADIPYQISASTTELFAVFLHKTMLGYVKIKVVALDPVNGRKTDEYTLSTENELASSDTIISVGANSASPIIAWTDAAYSSLKVNIVGSKSIQSFDIEKHDGFAVKKISLHAPYHINSRAHFLVHYETSESHWADVFHVNIKNSKIEKAYSLPRLPGRGAFATTTSDANVYFTRVTSDQIITVSSISHGVLGTWPLAKFNVLSGPGEVPYSMHIASELSIKNDKISAIRVAALLSTGDWVLLRDGVTVWQRPEVLARTVAAAFAMPSAVEELSHQLEEEAQSSLVNAYIHRLKRHLVELQRLPAMISALPGRLARALFGTSAQDGSTSDVFGFHKIITCATANGRVVAIDAGRPERIMWSRQAVNLSHGESWEPRIEASSGDALVLTTSPTLPQLLINASNGEIKHLTIPVQTSECNDSSDSSNVVYKIQNGRLEAFMKDTTSHSSTPLWHFSPTNGDRIVGLSPRPINDPVASIGKVLGDRSVLYKYIDPNLALLITANDARATLSAHILNTVTGMILYSTSHKDVDLRAQVSSVVSENWFAYSFTAEPSDVVTKGHYLVVGELFESLESDDRGSLNGPPVFSNFEASRRPFTLTKTYQVPEPIAELAVTQTRQGITSRQLLAVIPNSHAIVGIPYGAIDPRRPAGRDPTKDEQMEGLVRYSPVIEFDAKWYLNHRRELIGIKDVVTTPALLESTSILFAYGLDIFGTRLSPSFGFDILGVGFNKFQMLATVAGLAIATIVVAPLVMRKQVDLRWQFT